MPRWQRWTTYGVLAACAGTGLGWFVMLDALHALPPAARPWWVLHGITAVAAALVIGGAAVQHVVVTWRSARGRWAGGINVALIALLIVTALDLMYGGEAEHDAAHWIHAVGGTVAIAAFAWHVIWGRSRIPRLQKPAGKVAQPRAAGRARLDA